MNKYLLILVGALLSYYSNAQITFEKGYFILDTGEKTECFIRNTEWDNNPTEFKYKLTPDGEIMTASINSVVEFNINNNLKYIRFTGNIERSSTDPNKLSKSRQPEFQEETIFLKVLVEGDANLYMYKDGNIIKFFYSTGETAIEQLVFKLYYATQLEYAENNMYKQQILNSLKCNDISARMVESLSYKQAELTKFFMTYNACNNSEAVDFVKEQNRDLFNLTVRPGLQKSTFTMSNPVSISETKFDSQIGFRFGVEAEFVMPFNKKKWSLFVEPTYQYYESKQKYGNTMLDVDYKSIELPIGVRYSFYLKNSSNIFLDASYVIDIPLNSSIRIEQSTFEFEIDSKDNMAFGLGYQIKEKYSIELRYGLSRDLMNSYVYWSSDYTYLSIILGITLL